MEKSQWFIWFLYVDLLERNSGWNQNHFVHYMKLCEGVLARKYKFHIGKIGCFAVGIILKWLKIFTGVPSWYVGTLPVLGFMWKFKYRKLNVVNNVWVFKYQLHYKTYIQVYIVLKVYTKMNFFIATNTVTLTE